MLDQLQIAAALFSGVRDPHKDMPPAAQSQRELRARQEALLDAAVQESFPPRMPSR